MALENPCTRAQGDTACADLPDLKRLNYFYGQMLGVNDFRTEQSFFREKLKLHNRCLHGYGTVCGLMVAPLPKAQDCESESDHARQKVQAELDAVLAKLKQAPAGSADAKALEAQAEVIRRRLKSRCQTLKCLLWSPSRMKSWRHSQSPDAIWARVTVRRPAKADFACLCVVTIPTWIW